MTVLVIILVIVFALILVSFFATLWLSSKDSDQGSSPYGADGVDGP